MRLLTQHFERIAIISLAARQDRREKLTVQILTLGLAERTDLTISEAIPGRLCRPPRWFQAGQGAWGCLQSHLRVVQEALRDRVESLLILEDDCVFHPNTAEILSRFMPEVPPSWEQLYLGGEHRHPPDPLSRNSRVLRGTGIVRTHAYALKNSLYSEFMAQILEAESYLEREKWHIDHQIAECHRRGLWETYAPAWWMAGQRGGQSNIARRRNPDLWWHPQSYAPSLPMVIRDESRTTENSLIWSESGTNNATHADRPFSQRGRDLPDDESLEHVLKHIAEEAMVRGMLPGVSGIPVLEIQENWNAPVIHESATSCKTIGDFPLNGLFKHPFNRGGVQPIEKFLT